MLKEFWLSAKFDAFFEHETKHGPEEIRRRSGIGLEVKLAADGWVRHNEHHGGTVVDQAVANHENLGAKKGTGCQ